MARDYRYGHKRRAIIDRRSQQGSAAPAEAASAAHVDTAKETAKKEEVTATSAEHKPAAKADKKASAKTDAKAESKEAHTKPSESTSSDPPAADKKPAPKKRVIKQAKATIHQEIAPERSPEMQKALNNACRVSLPKTIQKETEEQAKQQAEKEEAKAKAEAEAKEQAKEQAEAIAVKKKSYWFRWLTAILVLLLMGAAIVWVWYAPFFLAFAFQMGWIDEAKRQQLDVTQARQQVMTIVEKPPLDQPKETAEQAQQAQKDAIEPMNFTFYHDLPKAAVQLAAQPLPVHTKAPVYLQIATIADPREAASERHRLAQKGYLVQLSNQVRNGKPVQVLRMGPYDDQRVINRLKVELQKFGVDAKEISMTAAAKAAEAAAVSPPSPLAKPNTTPAKVATPANTPSTATTTKPPPR